MSSEGGTNAVVAALAANTFIAVTKFGAWALTGSSSLLAEGIHSVADAGNRSCCWLWPASPARPRSAFRLRP